MFLKMIWSVGNLFSFVCNKYMQRGHDLDISSKLVYGSHSILGD